MSKKNILLTILIITILIIPYRVSASEFSGSCIDKYGTGKVAKNGSNNVTGGNVSGGLKGISGNKAQFYFNVQACGWHKVNTINYTIEDIDGNKCSGSIDSGLIKSNEGNVLLYFNLDKNSVKSISVDGSSVNRSLSNITENIAAYSIDVQENIKKYDGDIATEGNILSNTPLECDQTIIDLINKYWKYILILAPILLIVMCTIDFMKALISNDSDAIKKSSSAAFRRAIATLLLLLLPTLLKIIFTWAGIENSLCFD